ncbi:Zn(2)-C6 fungal-type domain-containing protein [Madurella fahalii]|uniref:Zn(2)-C6 fungal-type domain-containing protein n=1 Tax=Madurella fahalii TaxID=1157608 RepID=A0ABQ0FWP6_9PEZI
MIPPDLWATTVAARPLIRRSVPPTSIRKKRMACDNCHFSKVRCTGEMSGCQRCERGHKTCHYSESNMGRVPAGGVRKRRKSSLHKALVMFEAAAHPQLRQHHDWDSASPFESVDSGEFQQHAPPSIALRDRRCSDLAVDSSMSIWDEPSGPSQQQQQQELKSLLDNTGNDLDSLAFDPVISTFDEIDFEDIDEEPFKVVECPPDLAFPSLSVAQSSPPASPKHIQLRQQQQSHPETQTAELFNTPSSLASQGHGDSSYGLSQTAGTPSSSTDSVQYWTTQLEELSRTLQKFPVPLDGMLRHSSQLLPRIREALQSPHSAEGSSSITRLMLILVCLTQVVALFEQCVPSVLAGRSGAGSTDLSLRLGEFQVDRKVQQALQLHVMSKEVSSLLQVSRLIRQTLLRSEWRDVPKRTHDLLLEDLRARAVTLIYQMKQRRAGSRMVVS